jgi:hypothetical protein
MICGCCILVYLSAVLYAADEIRGLRGQLLGEKATPFLVGLIGSWGRVNRWPVAYRRIASQLRLTRVWPERLSSCAAITRAEFQPKERARTGRWLTVNRRMALVGRERGLTGSRSELNRMHQRHV